MSEAVKHLTTATAMIFGPGLFLVGLERVFYYGVEDFPGVMITAVGTVGILLANFMLERWFYTGGD